MQAQDNIIGLKRLGRLDLIEEEKYRPPKKVRETKLFGADGTSLLSAAAASQRRREQWFPYAGTAGELGTPGQFMRCVIIYAAGIPK